MLIAGLLLGAFVGVVIALLASAVRRGLLLGVVIDQRVTHHHVFHPHDGYPYPRTERLIETHVLPHAVLPRPAAGTPRLSAIRKEIER